MPARFGDDPTLTRLSFPPSPAARVAPARGRRPTSPQVVDASGHRVAVDELLELLTCSRVVVLRGHPTDDNALRELSRALTRRLTGERHPLELRMEVDTSHGHWRSDLSFLAHAPAIGVAGRRLPAHLRPPSRWIDGVHAHDSLPSDLQALAESLRALHVGTSDGGRITFQTAHPLVHIHPRTGERVLLISDAVRHIIGLSGAESDHLLGVLRAHTVRPEHQFELTWTPNDVIVWDNHAVMHDGLNPGGVPGDVRAFVFAGPLRTGIDGCSSRARHGDVRTLAASLS